MDRIAFVLLGKLHCGWQSRPMDAFVLFGENHGWTRMDTDGMVDLMFMNDGL